MNAQWAVNETEQTRITSKVVRRTDPRNKSPTAGRLPRARFLAACHSSGSGTALRTQKTSKAGRIPTRKRYLGCVETMEDISQLDNTASNTPMFTPLCSTAAIHSRHDLGQVSESNDAPTAHSPPMPRAERNLNKKSCHQVCAKNESPVNKA